MTYRYTHIYFDEKLDSDYMQALQTTVDPQAPIDQKVTFADGISEKYQAQISSLLTAIKKV